MLTIEWCQRFFLREAGHFLLFFSSLPLIFSYTFLFLKTVSNFSDEVFFQNLIALSGVIIMIVISLLCFSSPAAARGVHSFGPGYDYDGKKRSSN